MVRAYADRYHGEWITGGGWAMAGVPRRHAVGGRPRRGDRGPAGAAAQPRPPRRLGQHAGPRAGGHHGRDPGPRGRHGSSGSRTGARRAVCTRAPWTSWRGSCPAVPAAEYAAGLREGQRYLFALGVTAWQDAIVGAYAGMADTGSTYLDAIASGDLVADVVGALWWDRDLGLAQVPDLVERRRTQSGGRYRATSVKIMQDGVCENFTAAMLSPYLDRAWARHGQRRPLLRRGRGAEGGRRRAGGRGLPGARARDRRPRHPRGARRVRCRAGRGTRRRPAPPHRAHPGHPPRRRPALRRPRRRGERPGAVGLPRAADGRPDHPVPRRRAGDVAVPVRRAPPRRRPAGDGQRLAGQLTGPARRDPHGGHPHGVRR